jgi:AraC family transcriptional regulator, arabinose operon regulatory protein
MKNYIIPIRAPLDYHWTGKFSAPTQEWMHITRNLADFEFFIVTEGTLYIGDQKSRYTVRKGEYLLMGPTSYQHGYKASSCQFYWLHFVPSDENGEPGYRMISEDPLLSEYSVDQLVIPAHNVIIDYDRLIVLMKQLQDSDKRYHDRNLNKFLTSTILCELANQTSVFARHEKKRNRNQLYNDIVNYISWHSSENIKVGEVAGYFGYNEKYISVFFRKFSGETIKQFILQKKMDIAKAELSDTNDQISQIGYKIGFSDPHNFAHAFKKIVGLSPTAYRESFAERLLFFK